MTEPFIIKHYDSDERPTLKGNGFDGLEIGTEEDREWAEEFVAWVNARIGASVQPDADRLAAVKEIARLGQEMEQAPDQQAAARTTYGDRFDDYCTTCRQWRVHCRCVGEDKAADQQATPWTVEGCTFENGEGLVIRAADQQSACPVCGNVGPHPSCFDGLGLKPLPDKSSEGE